MLETKPFALRHSGMWKINDARLAHRTASSRGSRFVLLVFGAAILAALGPAVQAQRLPLPANEQTAVNDAIERGVDYLTHAQRKNGTWAKAKTAHPIGYAALPALTLLECGIAPSDPLIQRTAAYLRARSTKLDNTYELSLGILFLDRLGDPKDKKIIQTFALRLIAGQSMTGGWGYKCPLLSGPAQLELLTALRHLEPPPPDGMPGIVGAPGDLPALAEAPKNIPGLVGKPAGQPGELQPVIQVPGEIPQAGIATTPTTPALSGTTTSGSPGASLYPQASTSSSPSLGRDGRGLSPTLGKDLKPGSPSGPEKAPDKKNQPAKPDAKTKSENDKPITKAGADKPVAKAAKPYIIPERIQLLTVIQDPELHLLQDPKDKSNDLILTTTDNSNTQFAILALWTAQRYDVPMKRTLNLIVRRFTTSQNGDGTWGYYYSFGGNSWLRPAQMTCVGLIGLAVGHGLAEQAAGGKPVQDPRILNGLLALTQYIGQPANRAVNLPMQNLYFLWSLERAAVLYNLPMIGNKDWYRWGAQILVANQDIEGNWMNGQYHGSSPTIDTCLALLFLKRANLVKDLTAKLPFKPADLNDSIMEKLSPQAPKKTPVPIEKTTLPATPSKTAAADDLISKPLVGTTMTRPAEPDLASENENSGKKKWIVLSLVLFVLLSGSSVFFLLAAVNRKKDEGKEKHGKLKGIKGKRKNKSMTSSEDV